MDKHILQLFEQMHVLMHRIEGYLDFLEDTKPKLQILPFPGQTQQPSARTQEAVSFPNAPAQLTVRSDVGTDEPTQDNQKDTGIIEFTSQEILKMPKSFRNYFRIDGVKVHYRKKKNGVYELRCTINKQPFYGASTNLKEAKKKFIEDLHSKAKEETKTFTKTPTVQEYTLHYLDTFKKPNISQEGYRNYVGAAKNHIFKTVGAKLISELTATDCQQILNVLKEKGVGRMKEEVKLILRWVCSAAVADGFLRTDVMQNVKTTKHRRTTGKQIPAAEVRAYLEQEPQENYDYLIRFLLYTGLRPAEIKSAVFLGNFVTVKNAKTRIDEEPTFRRIPVHSALQPYVKKIQTVLTYSTDALNHKFKRRFPAFRLYDCRHTFTTRVQECGANKAWVDYVTNHRAAQNTTDRVYTHWSDEFSILQIEKLSF